MSASTPFRVQGERAAISIRLRQLETSDGVLADGDLVYAGRLHGKGVSYVQHPRSAGVEDFMLLDAPPPLTQGGASLDYDVSLESGVAGLRAVDGAVEFLDADGGPVLRMSPPMLEGADGKITLASVAVQGCAFDADPRAPWGRAPKPPGATMCTMHVSWDDTTLTYPALFDPAWIATGAMVGSTRRYHGASVLTDGRVLVSGGTTGSNTFAIYPTSELYNPATRTWAATGSFPSSTKLAFHTSSLLPSGKVAAVGGVDGSGIVLASLFLYDPAVGTWSTGPSMGNTHSSHTTTTLADGRLAVVGGYGGGTTPTNRVDLYNPTTNAWTVATSLPTARARHAAEILDTGKVLVAGGTDGTSLLASGLIYDAPLNTWTSTAGPMSTARADFTLTRVAGGLVLAAGGTNDPADATALSTAEIFAPSPRYFTPAAAAMLGARKRHTAVATQDGNRVLIVGGSSGTTALATVDEYDLVENAWLSESALPVAKQGHRSVLLKRGKVLTAGAGSAQTWGGGRTESGAASGSVLGVGWLTGPGNLAATDLLSVRIANATSVNQTYTLKVVARGLDDREATRSLGTFVIGTTAQTRTFAANQLPIQSVGTPAYAELRAEVTTAGGVVHVPSESLHYVFAPGYATATIIGPEPRRVPDLDPVAMFGSSAGMVTVNTTTLLSQVATAVAPLATLTGKVYNPVTNDYQDVASLPPIGGAGGTVKNSYPINGTFAELFGKGVGYAPLPPDVPAAVYTVCATWRATFVDSQFGEDVLATKTSTTVPASYAKFTIMRGPEKKAEGNLDVNGCATVTLGTGRSHVFNLEPNLKTPAPATSFTVRYRDRGQPGATPTWNISYVAQFGGPGVPISPPQIATITKESLVVATAFTTANAGGAIQIRSAWEDHATRLAAVAAKAVTRADSGYRPGAFQAYADQVGSNGTAATHLSISYIGPFTDLSGTASHNSRWKHVIAHEFGHGVQWALNGDLIAEDQYTGGVDALFQCGCTYVKPGDQGHCLTSRGPDSIGQGEGFAHFFAARLWNDLAAPECVFPYYKEVVQPDNVTIDKPPAVRSCDVAVKWLENHCSGAIAAKSVEWDWLNFLVAVNRGTGALTMGELRDVYRQTCTGGSGNCNDTTPTPFDAPVGSSSLVKSAEALHGLGSTKADQFRLKGIANGVNH